MDDERIIQLPRLGNYVHETWYTFRRDHCWICALRGPFGWLQGWHMKRVIRKMHDGG